LVFRPSAASDEVDVDIKNLAAGATLANVRSTPDAALVAPGSLFNAASFASGVLEQRFLGMEVKITPTGNRLNMSGVIKQVIATENFATASDVIDDRISGDRRSKYIAKRPGAPVRFNYVHQDSDVHGEYSGATHVALGTVTTAGLMLIAIEPDTTAAVSYLLEVIEHWEVVGTTVLGSTTPNHHNSPLYERIHHEAAKLHTALGSQYVQPEQQADHISKSLFGRGWDWLTGAASGLSKDVMKGAAAFGDLRSAYKTVSPLIGWGEKTAKAAVPLIEEVAPEMALIAL
jgi:hypothetical protein